MDGDRTLVWSASAEISSGFPVTAVEELSLEEDDGDGYVAPAQVQLDDTREITAEIARVNLVTMPPEFPAMAMMRENWSSSP